MNNRLHYIHRMNYSTQERLVGAFILAGLAVLITLLFFNYETLRFFQGQVRFVAYMQNAVGVNNDTKVRISGIEVGSVQHIGLSADNRFKVILGVYKDFHNLVRADSKASISKLAFIGDSVINISPGSIGQSILVDGSVIRVEETLTFDQIINNMKPVLDKINDGVEKVAALLDTLPNDTINSTLQDTAITMQNLKQMSEQIAAGQGTLGALIHDQTVYTELQHSLELMQSTMLDMQTTAQQTRVATESLPDTMRKLAETMDIIRREVDALPEIRTDTEELLNDMEAVVDAVKHTWPVANKLQQTTAPAPSLQPSHD